MPASSVETLAAKAPQDEAIEPLRLKLDHRPDRASGAKIIEAAIDVLQLHPRGDQLVELEPSIQISVRQHGRIAQRACAAVARAAQPLLAHQRAPAEAD